VTHQESPSTPARHATGCLRALAARLPIKRSIPVRARRPGRVLLGAGIAVALAASAPSPASAKQTRLFAGSFGEATSTPANPYPLASAGSLAVDSVTHDVYVADGENHRIERFDASGHFVFMLGLEVNKTAVTESATRKSEENVCPAAGHPADVCQAGRPGATPGAFLDPAFLAVDNSSGPSKGDLYVANTGAKNDLVEKFDASGQPVTTWGEAGEIRATGITDPPAPVAGPFGAVEGIAVDPSGNLWVSARAGGSLLGQKVFEFREDSSFVTGWTGEAGELAVDAADNLYFSNYTIRWFNSVGEEIGVVAPSAKELVEDNFSGGDEALDTATDSLYVAGREGFEAGTPHGIVKRYDLSACHPVFTHESPEPGCDAAESFGAGLINPNLAHPVAVDPVTNAVYVGDAGHVTTFSFLTVPDVTTTKPTGPSSSSATLTGVVNPSGVELNPGLAGCRFEWGETSAPYQHTEVSCDETAAQIGKGTEPVEVHAAITGLQAGKTYHYRLVASNANDVNASIDEPSFGADVSFGPPLIESAFAADVTSVTATLQVRLDPNDLDTHVRVEYGSEAGVYTGSIAAVDVGSAGSSQVATFPLSGLAPGTTYHYRAVAENVLAEGTEAVAGPDQTFITQTPGAFSLLDDRAWELVSPPNKRSAAIKTSHGFAGTIQAAVDGDAITYFARAPTEVEPPGYANTVQVLSARSASGWSSLDISTPNDIEADALQPPEYRFFSSDLSLSVAQPQGAFVPEISSEASEQTPYLRRDFPAGDLSSLCAVSCYRPLVSGKPGFENVPAGVEFGGLRGESANGEGVDFRGASPDGSHIVLSSSASLVEGAPLGSLYEWSAGQLQLISLLPGGGEPSTQNTEFGDIRNHRHAISSDGSRVIWSEANPSTGSQHVYLRDVATEETLQLDVNHGGSAQGPAKAVFRDASADGSVIFFTDEQRLTPGSGAATGEPDLYSCRVIVGESGELECALTDLSPANGLESAAVQGSDLGAGDDGSSVYFVANGVLAHNRVDNGGGGEEAEPGDCGKGIDKEQLHEDTCNLYLAHEGAITFIASISGEDETDWALNGPPAQPTRVSPNGRWLGFMSERSLTGYDNRDIATGRRAAEVYLYNAAEGGPGTLRCVSCDPTGARPRGIEYQKLGEGAFSGLDGDFGGWPSGELVAASVPSWNAVGGKAEEGGNQPRYLTDSGRVFFDGEDGLVPEDTNGTEDVYEYEPAGVGTCDGSSTTFGTRSGGCVEMISSGTSGEESGFLDASESGNDVFFLTAAQLSPRDTDTAYDVYDARVGGGEPMPVKPVECQGDACAGFVAAPSDPTPGSLTFQGPGNLNPFVSALAAPVKKTAAQLKAARLSKALKACRKDRSKRKLAQCERSARRRYGAVKRAAVKRASHDRGAKR
jgi:Tol biopolymer transport system component